MAEMKTLALIRHAKSDWGNETLSDFYRPLNERGNSDAPEMAGRIKKLGYAPDLIISSPALRAYSTALYFAVALGISTNDLRLQQELYDSDERSYMKAINETQDTIQTLFLFGHNPTITDLCNRIGGLRTDNVPTCGTAIFSFTISSWKDVQPGIGKLLHFEFPKKPK